MIQQANWSMGIAGLLAFTLAAPVAWAVDEEPRSQQQMQQSGSQPQMVRELESLPTGKDKEFYRQALKERDYQITRTTLDTEDVLQLEAKKNDQTIALSIGFDPTTGQSKQIDATMLPQTAQQAATEQSQQQTDGKTVARIPEVEEQLQVGKREAQTGGVRITKEVEEQPVEKQVQLQQEQIEVERHKVDRPLTEQDKKILQEGKDTIVVPKVVEKPVVSKEARVTEEVVVKKDQVTRPATVQDTVRETEVDVERMNKAPKQTAAASPQDQQAMAQQITESSQQQMKAEQQQAGNAQQQQVKQELQSLPTGKDQAFYRQTLQERGYEIIDTKSEQQQMELEVMKNGQTMLVTVQFAKEDGKSTDVSVSPKQEAPMQTSELD